MPTQPLYSIAALASVIDRAEPSRIQIFPPGEFDAPDGAMLGKGPWLMDAAAASRLIATVRKRKNALPVYYGHADLTAAQNGGKAIAAGWLGRESLEWVDGAGLFGTVDWTAAAKAHIEAGEYRYLSPLFAYSKADGRPLNLLSIGITNNPAIDGMAELAAASAALYPSESLMDDILERLCYLLCLPLTTTPAEMAAQLDKLKAMLEVGGASGPDPTAAASGPSTALRTGLFGWLESKDAAIAALKTAKPGPSEYAPVAALTAAQTELADTKTELAALQAKLVEREVEDLIGPAESDGRLLPGQLEWARDLGKSNLAALTAYLATAQPIAALARMQSGGKPPPTEAGALSAEDLAVCSSMGLSAEDFLKTRQGKKP